MEEVYYDPIVQLERLKRRRQKRRQLRRRRRLCALAVVCAFAAGGFLVFALGAGASADRHHAPLHKRALAIEVRSALAHLVIRRPQVASVSSAPASAPAVLPWTGSCPIPGWLRPAFTQASAESGVRLSLLTAVATVESGFDPQARSGVGAAGVMQLMPATAASLGVDPADPAANVSGGARYLSGLLSRFGSTELALAAYNAGPNAVEQAGGAPSLETLRYVLNVSALDRRYAGCN